jgi:coatomer subunit beta
MSDCLSWDRQVFFVREIMETNPKLRPTILERLIDTFSQIRSSRVCSCALWILSEYSTSVEDIHAALDVRTHQHSFAKIL